MMVLWAANTERFQKLLGFNFVLPPPTPLPLDPPSSPFDTLSQNEDAGAPNKGFLENGAENLNDDEPSSRGASKWDKASSDISELLKMGVRVWRGDGDGWKVTCDNGEVCWRAMVTTHWPKLLEHYGRPTQSRYIGLLRIMSFCSQMMHVLYGIFMYVKNFFYFQIFDSFATHYSDL